MARINSEAAVAGDVIELMKSVRHWLGGALWQRTRHR
jgi:hypothetical protein